jgi:hypothetical protein
MVNITIQNLEVESTALNQVSPCEMEKVVGGFVTDAVVTTLMNAFMLEGITNALTEVLELVLSQSSETQGKGNKKGCGQKVWESK